ncbi:hypothetical protein [Vibrio owensii]|uniref:hypothetical protein n=1 Tax=Vibrio owensii TaxID=696485 RepID=UPI0038CE5123
MQWVIGHEAFQRGRPALFTGRTDALFGDFKVLILMDAFDEHTNVVGVGFRLIIFALLKQKRQAYPNDSHNERKGDGGFNQSKAALC